jgi:signal transduction histidine kinase
MQTHRARGFSSTRIAGRCNSRFTNGVYIGCREPGPAGGAVEEDEQMASSALSLSTMHAGVGERRAALVAALASLAFFAATAPFARVPLGALPAFYPLCQSALVVCDLLTAVLLFGQFTVTRAPALAVLGAGYVFGAAMAVAHALSFPGLFSPAGLIGGPQTTAWLYFLWHAGFPLYLLAYACMGDAPLDTRARRLPGKLSMAALCGVVPAVALAVLASAGHDWLPAVMLGDRDRPLKLAVAVLTWSLALAPLVLLWRRRPHTVLDLSLIVVLCAWCADSALAAVLNQGRFDVGWYAGRVFGLLASGLVLGALLLENVRLHVNLATAHRELQASGEAVAAANRRLAIANDDLDRFVGGVAHDLQQPVLTIAGYAQVVQRQAGDSLGAKESAGLERIVAAAQTADRMIQGLLQFARLGQADLVLEPVDLHSMVADARAALAADAERHRVEWHVAPLPTVHGDPVLLGLAFVNLLSNAIKYSRTREAPLIEIDAQPRAGGGQLVRIRDNGVGFDMAHAARLFTPFERLHGAAEFEGTGMGLANVRRIMERHGGTIRAEAAPGQGATFYLEFVA